jgi:hypothetical protein
VKAIALALLLLTAAPLAHADPKWGQCAGEPAYIASFGAVTCNQTNVLAIESSVMVGFRLIGWCVNVSQATAAAAVNVVVRRANTVASTGGTTLTPEGTGTFAIASMSLSDPTYGGVARGGAATPGTAGATLDQVGFSIAELGAGVADPTGNGPFCKWYGVSGEKLPTVPPGVLNGLSISVSAAGAGALASCAVSAVICTP